MDIFTRRELATLLSRPGELGVAIYMPTNPVNEKEQDPIRLKNLLKTAEQKLVDAGVRRPKVKSFLEPAGRMLDDALFWRHRGRGLAVYASPDYFAYYRTPYEVSESVTVGERFHVAPMMPLLYNDGRYYVLALSENRVRLLECTRDGYRNATPENMPQNQAGAVKLDTPEEHRQYHNAGTGKASRSVAEAGSRATVGAGSQIWHGTSVLKDVEKTYILEYFQRVDHALKDIIKENKEPLVLAAVSYLHPIYHAANSYGGLLPEGLTGNFDDTSEQSLHDKAWALIEPVFSANMRRALDNYHLAASRGLASTDLSTVLSAVYDGRVGFLVNYSLTLILKQKRNSFPWKTFTDG